MAVKIKKGNEMMQIPVVPLVDTVFNLLIFFLVATKVAEAEKELPIQAPYAGEAQAITVRPAINAAPAKGTIWMNWRREVMKIDSERGGEGIPLATIRTRSRGSRCHAAQ